MVVRLYGELAREVEQGTYYVMGIRVSRFFFQSFVNIFVCMTLFVACLYEFIYRYLVEKNIVFRAFIYKMEVLMPTYPIETEEVTKSIKTYLKYFNFKFAGTK